MKVYHGSHVEITKIELAKCLPQRDFGQGFYVTKFKHHAETWAKIIGRKHQTQGVVTEFDYTESPFARHICKIKRFDAYDGEWLDFVVENRRNKKEQAVHDYDIVEGPVADDKVQFRIKDYLKGKVSKQQFLDELRFHEETHQICFCTKVSLQLLENTKELVSEFAHINEPVIEKLVLDSGMDDKAAAEIFFSSATFAQLADASTGLHLKPWHEIFEMFKTELKSKEN